MRSSLAVVNGTQVKDWQAVYDLAKSSPRIIPSFGLHPWFLKDAPVSWRDTLRHYLQAIPSGVGEVGLDRVRNDIPFEQQEEVFREQVEIALSYNRPLSIHSVKSDERVLAILKSTGQRNFGFLMHSFTGSKEIARKLLDLGAYLSLSGATLHHEGQKARSLLGYIPRDRLLLETDAPNQPPPRELYQSPLQDETSKQVLNHPAAIKAIYTRISQLLKIDLTELQEIVAKNFDRLFGSIMR